MIISFYAAKLQLANGIGSIKIRRMNAKIRHKVYLCIILPFFITFYSPFNKKNNPE